METLNIIECRWPLSFLTTARSWQIGAVASFWNLNFDWPEDHFTTNTSPTIDEKILLLDHVLHMADGGGLHETQATDRSTTLSVLELVRIKSHRLSIYSALVEFDGPTNEIKMTYRRGSSSEIWYMQHVFIDKVSLGILNNSLWDTFQHTILVIVTYHGVLALNLMSLLFSSGRLNLGQSSVWKAASSPSCSAGNVGTLDKFLCSARKSWFLSWLSVGIAQPADTSPTIAAAITPNRAIDKLVMVSEWIIYTVTIPKIFYIFCLFLPLLTYVF